LIAGSDPGHSTRKVAGIFVFKRIGNNFSVPLYGDCAAEKKAKEPRHTNKAIIFFKVYSSSDW